MCARYRQHHRNPLQLHISQKQPDFTTTTLIVTSTTFFCARMTSVDASFRPQFGVKQYHSEARAFHSNAVILAVVYFIVSQLLCCVSR